LKLFQAKIIKETVIQGDGQPYLAGDVFLWRTSWGSIKSALTTEISVVNKEFNF
jgi:hypothetical protein